MVQAEGSVFEGMISEACPDTSAPFVPASTIKNRSVKRAIPCFIALGDVSIFAGPRKCAKSMMAAHLASCFTNGTAFAPGLGVMPEAQGDVVLYNGERAIDCFAIAPCRLHLPVHQLAKAFERYPDRQEHSYDRRQEE